MSKRRPSAAARQYYRIGPLLAQAMGNDDSGCFSFSPIAPIEDFSAVRRFERRRLFFKIRHAFTPPSAPIVRDMLRPDLQGRVVGSIRLKTAMPGPADPMVSANQTPV